MRHLRAPYIAAVAALLLADAAEACTLTIRQRGAPEVTITVPGGWRAQERRLSTVLTRGDRRVAVYQCPMRRTMSQRTPMDVISRRVDASVPIRGGSCLLVHGADERFARRLKPVLGRGGPAPASDGAAEQLARAARARTLAQPRKVGTATALPFGWTTPIESTFAYDTGYSHQIMRLRGYVAETLHDATGDHLREDGATCWGSTTKPEEDDALEPLLELEEWDAPPSTKTSWHVSYSPAEALPDGSTRVRWTGFVADGEAIVGADGLLRHVRIDDHHMARGRSSWRTVTVTFSGFPAAITRVSAQPRC